MLRKMAITFLAASSFWAADACADTPTSNEKPGANEAWILVGVQPNKARLSIVSTTIKDGLIRRTSPQLFLYKPTDGFVLIKVKPGEVYSIPSSSLTIGNTFFQVLYGATCEAPTFSANAGKVDYITTLIFKSEGASSNGMIMTFEESVGYSKDIESAKAFLASHYPSSVDNLEQGTYQMTPFHQKCTTP
jgi:hypothetical protein